VQSLDKLRVGDVIEVPAGKWSGIAVVIDPGTRSNREGPRPLVVTLDRQARRLSIVDFPTPVEPLTRMRIAKTFNARNPQQRRDLAALLRDRTRDLPRPSGEARRDKGNPAHDDAEVLRLRTAIRAHPCHDCPVREDHARWAERYVKLERETANIRRRIEQRTNTIARQFDRVCEVLEELDYLHGDEVTEAGGALARIYSELDLVAAECLRRGTWNGLEVPQLAAVLSALVFEARNPDDADAPRIPGGPVRQVLADMVEIWADLDAVERQHRLAYLREPDLGFAWAAYRWAGGVELDDVLDDVDLAPGDFVRWVKQVLDLAEQIADAAGDTPLRRTAREVSHSMRRGVVAYSAELE
jgi:ATP-dependent RNA helicase HelY